MVENEVGGAGMSGEEVICGGVRKGDRGAGTVSGEVGAGVGGIGPDGGGVGGVEVIYNPWNFNIFNVLNYFSKMSFIVLMFLFFLNDKLFNVYYLPKFF